MNSGIGDSSAAERNKRSIFDALVPWLADAETVLEIGAGDATHARHAACRLPHIRWQTSEAPGHVRRLAAAMVDNKAADDEGLRAQQLPRPIALDVRHHWPAGLWDAIFAANVAHIMDWEAVQALCAGAGGHLNPGGLLALYGPFLEGAAGPPAASNERFDRALRAQSPAMGLRDVADLETLATGADLVPAADVEMPANNRLLIWRLAYSC